MSYVFGDTDLAIRRLEVVARVFNRPSRDLLRSIATRAFGLAVDLGCGAGFTTALVADAVAPAQLVGLDASERLLAHAQQRLGERAAFHLHDVTTVPFPVGPADLLYARMLLTHLRDPADLLARWATQLAPGGLLLVDEVESIATEDRTLREYLSIVEAFLAHRGADLYVGARLAGLAPPGLAERASLLRRWPVAGRRAAEMFRLNLEAWRAQPFVHQRWTGRAIHRLARALEKLAGSEQPDEVVWGLRQITFQRQE